MSSQLIPFSFESHEIRVMLVDNTPWWVAADVCAALDIGNISMALSRLDDDEKGISSVDTLGGKQDVLTVNEPGLYSLILGSRKPEAKAFKRWVTHEVIPSIRQTGSYTVPNAKPAPLADVILLKNRQAKSTLNLYLTAAKLLGTDAPMARAIAVDVVKRQTGVDFQPLLIGNVIEEKPLTPTELGKLRNWTARGTNLQLALAGFQARNDDGEWLPTEKGKAYCTCNPYKAPHSQHTGYRTLWYRAVLDLLPVSSQEEVA